ncbi:MAG: IS21 family transposase [Chloroflexi bacterium]|nr:IS21 family transposase [Chloroflexota bacterium]
MLTQGEDVEAHALVNRGWSISAIARHLGRDRKTVRAYVRGERSPGVRRPASPDPLEPFVPYLAARFLDDPHLWLTALFDEVRLLGYARSYPSFVRWVRRAGLRPHCERCAGVKGRATIEIDHPPGDEIQWDWFERRRAPWGGTAHVLLGTLPHSSRVRGVITTSEDQPHLVDALDGVLRRLGGTTPAWRTDRLATVIVPGTADVQASFAPVARHYGVVIRPCPPRRGNRKGSVEASVRYLCGRWWRTLTARTIEEAQASLDHFCETIADARPREGLTVGELAAGEHLLPLPPVPYPASLEVTVSVAADATVAFRGARYSVPPGLIGAQLTVRSRLGSPSLEIVGTAGSLLAVHRVARGGVHRLPEHRSALEATVLGAFTTRPPCERKGNQPPGPAARAAAVMLRSPEAREVVVDLARYAELVEAVR